jgi:ribose-phosphate pyrophosphokinase
MISTGATIAAAARVLRAHGGAPALVVAATHGLLVAGAADRLTLLRLRCAVATDSLLCSQLQAPMLQVQSIAPLLADAIGRLHHDQSLWDLLTRT